MVLTVGDALYNYLAPQAADFSKLDLPEALIHWGHPGNMCVCGKEVTFKLYCFDGCPLTYCFCSLTVAKKCGQDV